MFGGADYAGFRAWTSTSIFAADGISRVPMLPRKNHSTVGITRVQFLGRRSNEIQVFKILYSKVSNKFERFLMLKMLVRSRKV